MFDLRETVYQLMIGDEQLMELVDEDAVFQRTGSEDQVPTGKRPFIVYYLGTESTAGPSALRARTKQVLIWAHDTPGDYNRLDQVLSRVREIFEGAGAMDALLEIRFVTTSPDLSDTDMRTIVRYTTFNATIAPGGT